MRRERAHMDRIANKCDLSIIWFPDFKPPVCTWILAALKSKFHPPTTVALFFFSCVNHTFDPAVSISCCLCPHLSFCVLLLCPSFPFLFLPPLPSPTLFTLILNSPCVPARLFLPLSSSALVKNPLPPFPAPPWFTSSVHSLRIFGPGRPLPSPAVGVFTYPAGWQCTAGWRSVLRCWAPRRRGTPRLGTSGPCRGAGTGTPSGSGCWCHSERAPRRPTPRWAARTAPGSAGWSASAWQWCWPSCL